MSVPNFSGPNAHQAETNLVSANTKESSERESLIFNNLTDRLDIEEKTGHSNERPVNASNVDYKGQQKYSSTAKTVQAKQDWTDLVSSDESEDEQKLISELASKLFSIDADEGRETKFLEFPLGFSKACPSYGEIVTMAAKFCGLVYRETTLVTIDDLRLREPSLYSMDPKVRSTAAGSLRATDLSTHTALKSVVSLFNFFCRPIDVKRINFAPTMAEAYILDLIIRDYVHYRSPKSSPNDYFLGIRTGREARNHVLTQIASMFLGSSRDIAANLMLNSLDKLIHQYTKKIYRNAAATDYFVAILDAGLAKPSVIASRLHKSMKVRVEKPSVQNGKIKLEQVWKTAQIMPWINKADGYFTSYENKCVDTINICLKRIPDFIEIDESQANPAHNGIIGRIAVETLFNVSDAWNRVTKQRKRVIRTDIFASRTLDEKRNKVLPSEWQGAQARFMADIVRREQETQSLTQGMDNLESATVVLRSLVKANLRSQSSRLDETYLPKPVSGMIMPEDLGKIQEPDYSHDWKNTSHDQKTDGSNFDQSEELEA